MRGFVIGRHYHAQHPLPPSLCASSTAITTGDDVIGGLD
jgi:hypothetical protein